MISKFLATTILTLLLTGFTSAQIANESASQKANLQQTFEFAEQQLRQGWTDRAEKTYKRVLFFDKKNQYRGRCMEVLATIALEKASFLEALNYLDQAYFLSKDEVQQNTFQLQRIQIFIQTEQIHKALAEIYQADDSFDPRRLAPYEAYCQYWLKDFESVKSILRGLVIDEKLNLFMSQANKIEKMNPKFFQTMSYILPGSGQILLGDFRQSANSILLNAGLGVLFINTVSRLGIFDGIISVLPWFYRYYSGGAKLTKQLAIEKKKKRHQNNLRELLNSID